MNKYKEIILNNTIKGKGDSTNTSNETTNANNTVTTPATSTNNTTTTITGLNETYAYGVGILAVLDIGVCVFLTYNTFQPKKLINKCLAAKHEQKLPRKRRHML